MANDSAALRTVELYDTREGKQKPLEPRQSGHVGMYVCGVTVYDLTHIGHARVYVFFDVVERFLEHLGYDVTHVRNFTDVDDKIINRAEETGDDPLELSARFIEEFNDDMSALGVRHADHEPKVSECIDEIIEMNETLIERGYAYEVDGDVFYRVEEFDGYGKLSHRDLDEMEAGRSGRTEDEADDKKKHPFDFALWKSSEDDELGWESPWGYGRPGWHIECSVMSTKYLGECFDIHGGGSDLIFPHHENEIAQSEAANDCEPLANHWMHMGLVNVVSEEDDEVEKMSKSLDNFWTTRDVLDEFDNEAVRYFLLTAHYRKPITYSMDNLEEATQRVEYLYATLERIGERLTQLGHREGESLPDGELVGSVESTVTGFLPKFEAALADDFNTSEALAVLGDLAKAGNELATEVGSTNPNASPEDLAFSLVAIESHMRKAGSILGVLERPYSEALREIRNLKLQDRDITPEEIEELIAERKEARENEDYERADAIRDELVDHGIELMDKDWGTLWRAR